MRPSVLLAAQTGAAGGARRGRIYTLQGGGRRPTPPRTAMPRPRLFRRALVSTLVSLALMAAVASGAFAHASLVRSSPAPGERLEEAPDRVTLVFSEPLNPALARAELRSSDGRFVPASLRVVHRTRLVLEPRSPLPPRAYRLRWRSVSTIDAHPLEGSLGFGVRMAAGGRAHSLQGSPLATGGWLRAPARAALYAALLLFSGGLLVTALLGGANGGTWLVPAGLARRAGESGLDVDAARARARALTVDSGVLTVGLAALVAAIESFTAAGRASARALADFLLTGTAGPARIGVAAFAVLALALRGRRRAGALAAAAALACVTVSGHAASAQPRAAALAADYLHLLAGAVWLGGAATLVAVWWPGLRRAGTAARREVARLVLPPFGVVAVSAFVVVAVTGTLNAAIELGRLSALWETAYGAVLAVKVALVLLIATVSYLHVRRLRPRLLSANPHPAPGVERAHWALLRADVLLSFAVVAAAAALVVFPLPPRQLETARGAVAVAPCDPCPLPAPARGELAVADLAGSQVVAAWMRRTPAGLAGTIRLLDRRGRPARGPVWVPAGSVRACGPGCFRFDVRGRPDTLVVAVSDAGRRHRVPLPASWLAGQSARARRLLERAQRTMRSAPSLREVERVTSGPGTLAVTEYRLRAPDRVAWTTDRGVQAVQIGRGQWLRLPGQPWRRRGVAGGVAFSTSSWFRWTPYVGAVELLAVRRRAGLEIAELATIDPGTPVWSRLSVDVRTGRVLQERLVTRSRLVTRRFFDFEAPVTIEPPVVDRR
jgi:copper transport protein